MISTISNWSFRFCWSSSHKESYVELLSQYTPLKIVCHDVGYKLTVKYLSFSIHMQRDTYLSVWVIASFCWQNSYTHEVVCINQEVCPGTENYKNADTVNFMRRNITTAFKPILLRHHVRMQHPSSHFYAPSMIWFSLHYLMYFGSKLMVWHKLSHIKTLEWILLSRSLIYIIINYWL